MLEIPGEEAPTDPGAHVRAQQAALRQVEARSQRHRRGAGYLVGALVMVGLVAAGGWRLQKEREALTYNLDDYYVMPLEDIVVAAEAVPEEPAAVPAPDVVATRSRTNSASKAPLAVATAPEGAAGSGMRSGAAGGDALPPDLAAAMAQGGSTTLGGANIAVTRPDVVLSDPAEIKAMIGRVLSGSRPQLNACYQQRLKQVEGLRGTWDVQFTVGTSGAATDIAARGRDRQDGELESCMARAVAGWRFSRVARPVGPVQVPFQFSAG